MTGFQAALYLWLDTREIGGVWSTLVVQGHSF